MRVFVLLLTVFVLHLEALQVGGLTYFNTLQPGESKTIPITLISDKNTPEFVELKLCDYGCNSEGQHFFEEVGTQPRSNGSWINLNTLRETINPGEQKEIYFTIQVPKDKPLKGSYWSVLLIEPSNPLHTLAEAKDGIQLQVKVRYAYHIVTNIGEGIPSIKILNKGLENSAGIKYFIVDTQNNGDLFLNPKMTVKLYNNKGKLERTLETQTERLYPGSSVRFMANADGLLDGKYTAFLLFDNGDGRIFGDTYQITAQ